MAKIPKFDSIEEESDFWDTHSFVDYEEDMTLLEDVVFVDQRPKLEISLRMNQSMIDQIELIAAARNLGYQTLIAIWVRERLRQEVEAAERATGEVVSTLR